MEKITFSYDVIGELSTSDRIGLFRKAVERCDEKQVEQADYCSNQRSQPINMTKTAILKKGWNLDMLRMYMVVRDNTTLIKVTVPRQDNASLEFFLAMYVEPQYLQAYLDKLTPLRN